MNTFGSITYEFFNNKKNYHFDLTGAFSNIIEESEAIIVKGALLVISGKCCCNLAYLSFADSKRKMSAFNCDNIKAKVIHIQHFVPMLGSRLYFFVE